MGVSALPVQLLRLVPGLRRQAGQEEGGVHRWKKLAHEAGGVKKGAKGGRRAPFCRGRMQQGRGGGRGLVRPYPASEGENQGEGEMKRLRGRCGCQWLEWGLN